MAAFTIANLKEAEDQAPKFGFAPNIEARFANEPLELEKLGISYQRIAPNFRQPFGHKQKQQEELYVLLDGSARAKLDDEIVDLTRWDAVRVAPEVARCFEAGPDGAEMLVIGAPNTGSPAEDVEPLPGWWTD